MAECAQCVAGERAFMRAHVSLFALCALSSWVGVVGVECACVQVYAMGLLVHVMAFVLGEQSVRLCAYAMASCLGFSYVGARKKVYCTGLRVWSRTDWNNNNNSCILPPTIAWSANWPNTSKNQHSQHKMIKLA